MNQSLLDKFAILLSALCALHCLALPLLVGTLPLISAASLESEVFHINLLFIVVPVSGVALWMSWRKQSDRAVGFYLLTGLAIMVAAVSLGHHYFGTKGETALTLLGAAILVRGHWQNYRLQQQNCRCGDTA